MKQMIMRFWKEESGAAMAEYGLLLVLIALLVAAVALYLGEQIQEAFSKVAQCMVAASADGATVETIGAACGVYTPGS